MVALYITSLEEAAGKSTLCLGIGRHLLSEGKRVGFLKPLATEGIDPDAEFARQALELKEPVEALCPLYQDLKKAYDQVSPGKDIVLVEGPSLDGGSKASYESAEALEAKAIIVTRYSTVKPWARVAPAAKEFGHHLLGIVVNAVPGNKLASVYNEMLSAPEREGIRVLGVLPEKRILLTVSVGELAEYLQAEVLPDSQATEELIESLMLGALGVDSGLDYFHRKEGKTVIVRGERPDLQLAALATSIKCLILTGDTPPIPQVRYWAEERGVPILVVKEDTLSTVAAIEEIFLKTRFRQAKKLKPLEELLQQHFDFPTLYQQLALE